MVARLLGKYGRIEKSVKDYIAERQSAIPEEEKDNLCQKIIRECRTSPDMDYIQNLLRDYEPKKSIKAYYWCICLECGAEYGGNMIMCPVCYSNGLLCKDRAIKTSEDKPDLRKVIRYNKACEPQSGYKSCYVCENKYMSFCPDFGEPKKCSYDEQRNCKCYSCCQHEYMMNQKIEQSIVANQVKHRYAIPLSQAKNYN